MDRSRGQQELGQAETVILGEVSEMGRCAEGRQIVDLSVRIFLAGIMQGSHRTARVHDQQYRRRLVDQLRRYLPRCDIYDPWADHQDSLEYSDEDGRNVFFHHNRLCAQVDLVIAYVPEASMGTAIEMWEAHRHGRIVVTVSPLAHNWTVKFLSDLVYPDWEPFFADLTSGKFGEWLESARRAKTRAAHEERRMVPGV